MPDATVMFSGAQPCLRASAARRSVDSGSPYHDVRASASRIAASAAGGGPKALSLAPSRSSSAWPARRASSSGATNGVVAGTASTCAVGRGASLSAPTPRPARRRRCSG